MGGIVNRFSILLGERRLKISDVHKLTGLSRTTLTDLYYDKAQAISLNTLSILCDALECEVSDIFTVVHPRLKTANAEEYNSIIPFLENPSRAIKNAREAKGLSQSELGEKIGVTQQMLSQWESGKRIPKATTIRRIYCAIVSCPSRQRIEIEQRIEIGRLLFNPGFGDVGDNIRALRKQSNYTQQQLADAVGVNVQTIRSYESGVYKPKDDIRMKLLDVFLQVRIEEENRNDENIKLD